MSSKVARMRPRIVGTRAIVRTSVGTSEKRVVKAWWRGWRLVRVQLSGHGDPRDVLGFSMPGEISRTQWHLVIGVPPSAKLTKLEKRSLDLATAA